VFDCDACVPACPPDAIYDDEDHCIEEEGNEESVIKNYKFFGHEWDGEPL
jgi:ferredoxin